MTEEEEKPCYTLSLSIKHPNLDPEDITRRLGVTPSRSWSAGSERETPAGTRLSGTNDSSYWVASRKAVGERAFFDGMNRWIESLESSSDFIELITSTGGTIMIVIGLPGRINIGDEIADSGLARLCRLNIHLGVEVFPNLPFPTST
jgi:hypothetical protein